MTLITHENIMDTESDYNYRKVTQGVLSQQSEQRSNQGRDTEFRRKKSNPPVPIPLLDLSRLSIKNEVAVATKKQQSVDNKSIE